MIRRVSCLTVLLVLAAPLATFAQPWSGILSPSRAIDWSGAGVSGGIPVRTTICATLAPGASATQINSAIQSCPAGQVVKLGAGTYTLSAGITFDGKSNVTLRGAGPDQTFLVFSGTDNCMGQGGDVCVRGSDYGYYVGSPAHVANWTAGYAKGTTQITLSSTSGLSVGMLIVLDQLNDSADTGQIVVCSIAGVCSSNGGGGGGRANREQEQFVTVTAINGNTVTINPGLHMPNWRTSQSPQAFWGSPSSYIVGAGVEDLSMNHAGSGGTSGLYFIFARDSWVRNVQSLTANRNHVWLYESAHITVQDSYFYATKNAASLSYGIEEFMASDNLIQNNILHRIATPLQTNMGSGSVFAYNYSFDDYYSVSAAWQQASSYLHAAGADFVLHEGNVGSGFDGDLVHGSHNLITMFRNYWMGWETGKTAQTVPIILYSYNRYMNAVGNVLGKPGYHTSYESYPGSETDGNKVAFRLGMGDGGVPDDPLTRTTMVRWGNYDVATSTARFQASEIPSSLSPYGNPVPASQSLPASFYLSSKPSAWWATPWGTPPWPAIGPDVSGGTIAGLSGHAAKIPAQLCYENIAKGSNGVLASFNANSCYMTSAGGPPNAPSSLVVK